MASLAPLKQHFHKLDGTIASGYYLTFYAAGTTTPQNTYTDQSGGTPNLNPVELDTRGEASIWYDPTLNYKVVLSSDALAASVEWTMDVVASIPDNTTFVVQKKGADIASAATINLDTATGDYVHVTGNTTINVITLASGKERTVVFDGTPQLTHSASLILPNGGSNIIATAGDTAKFRGEGSAITRCVEYQRANASALDVATVTASGTITSNGLLDVVGGQVKFPATQVPSANANTLDDYEEGTWTPTLGGTATYSGQSGTYTKIGNLVHCEGSFIVNAIGTGSTAIISGLPFAASGEPVGSCRVTVSATAIVSAIIKGSGSTVVVWSRVAASANDGTNAIFQNGTNCQFSISYRV